MPRGAFITIEGGEGLGKTTGMSAIESALTSASIDFISTREPGGTSLGERIREWILEGDHDGLSAHVEALLMFAARAEHLDTVIEPALRAGSWVICDRFTDATYAYQGGGRGVRLDFLREIAKEIQGALLPDFTILLDAPVEVGIERISNREPDHFERAGTDFLRRVRDAYLDLARKEPERIQIIDASRSAEAVTADISDSVAAFCERFSPAR